MSQEPIHRMQTLQESGNGNSVQLPAEPMRSHKIMRENDLHATKIRDRLFRSLG
jgi:hypothetical protein